MGVFTDKNGERITSIDSKNIAEFQQWLQKEPDPKIGDGNNIQLDTSLSVDDVLKKDNGEYIKLKENQQKYLASVFVRSPSLNEKWGSEMLDKASKYPDLVGYAYRISGYGNGRGEIYTQMYKEFPKRKIEDNIPAHWAICKYGMYVAGSQYLGKGNIRTLSASNQGKLREIFSEMKKYDEYRGDDYENLKASAAGQIMRGFAPKLLNYENATSEMREFINREIFMDYSTRNGKLTEMDEKFYTKDMMRIIIGKEGIRYPRNYVNTKNPQTQKEKNEGILPINYRKFKSVLVRYAEKENKYDRNNYGKEKTLTQRYKDMMGKMLEVGSWEEIPPRTKEGLLEDVHLYTAQKDIMNGRAKDLSDEELKMVLANDKENYYTRKLKDILKERPELKLGRDKESIIYFDKGNHFEYFGENKKLSYEEKMSVLTKQEKIYDNEKSKNETQRNEQIIADFKEIKDQLKVLNKEKNESSFLVESVKTIQEEYKGIINTFKNGKANPEEEYLQKENMEQMIQDFMTGKISQIPLPKYKSLPLLFGRKDEKVRREMMSVRINKFNEILCNDKSNSERYHEKSFAELSQNYSGKMLEEESLNSIQEKHQENLRKSDVFDRRYSNQEIKYRNATYTENKKQEEWNKVKYVKDVVEKRHKKLHEAAKENLPTEQSKLQAVTTQNADEKRVIRAQNKKDARDPLQDKEENLSGKTTEEKYTFLKKLKDNRLR